MSEARLERVVPIVAWLRQYQAAWLRADVVAGLTAAAVVIPKALAYAAIATVPLGLGLNAAVIPMLAYVVLGSSRRLSVSSTSTIAILVAAGAAPFSSEPARVAAAAATLAFLAGVMLLIARVLRLGFLADFISEPVLTGFKAGIGVVIVVDQVPKLLGIHIEKAGFFRDIVSILKHLPETSLVTVVVSAVALALMALLPRLVPRLPAPLVVVGGAIVASKLAGLAAHGVAIVGDVPLGLPSLTVPTLELARELWPAALGIALMAFTESIAAGRAFAQEGERPRPSQELVAIGAGNVIGGLFGTMPSGGGTSQTAVNVGAGARSQIAGATTALVAVACLLFLGPAIGLMPQAVLAAVVIATSIGLIQPHEFREILAVRRVEFSWALVAFAGVVLLGTLKGILVAVIASLVFLAAQAQNPPVYRLGRKRGTNVFRALSAEHPDDETFPGLVLLRVEGRVFFANAQRIADRIAPLAADAKGKVVVLDCSAILDLEYTALKMLTEAEERLRRQGTLLCLAALNPQVLRVIGAAPLGATLGRERMFFNLEQAVEKAGGLVPPAPAPAS